MSNELNVCFFYVVNHGILKGFIPIKILNISYSIVDMTKFLSGGASFWHCNIKFTFSVKTKQKLMSSVFMFFASASVLT